MIKIKTDSRCVTKGDIFVCIKGDNYDGHDYVDEAIKNGAIKIITEKKLDINITQLVVEDSKKWLEKYLVNNYSYYINKVNLIGVTGTNGKTTTSYLTYQLLNKIGVRTSYIGTLGYYKPNNDFIELKNTTPDILTLYSLIIDSLNNGITNVVMEVSSQGLDMGRTNGLNFRIVLFTNLTQDHLDYHHTMDNYLNSKLKILNQLYGTLLVNNDDNYSKYWDFKNKKTYGMSMSNYQIYNIDNNLITLKYNRDKYVIKNPLYGLFNVYNLISSIAICHELGYSFDKIIKYTEHLIPPKGRCESYNVQDGLAIIDYAHTPDAVLKILESFKDKKIITVIGCGGNRDKSKRPIMGLIATENSYYVIFTNDNPRFENPDDIIKDITTGLINKNYEVIYDREKAINTALDMIKANTVVLILGKGHENYQIINNTKYEFDDSEIVKKYIKKKISD